MNLRIPISQNCYNSAKRKAKDSKGKLPLALGAIGVHIFVQFHSRKNNSRAVVVVVVGAAYSHMH